MSWSLLLNKFPKSILSAPEPLLVLALIDRAGLSTELELVDMFDGSSSELKKTLLKLQMDEFLSFGEHHIKITEAGREVLDRLSLVDDVVRDVLDSLQLHGHERAVYQKLLESFRRDSLQLYQNSICTLRQWQSIATAMPDSDTYEAHSLEVTAGLRSLFVRDIRNWASHSKEGFDATQRSEKRFLSLIWMNESFGDSLLPSASAIDRNTYIFMAHLLHGSVNSSRTKSPDGEPRLLPVFLDFHRYQTCSAPDLWFDKLAVEFKAPARRRYKAADSFITQLRRALEVITPRPPKAAADAPLQYYVHSWRPTPRRTGTNNDLLSQMLASESMIEFCSRSGTAPPEGRKIVSEVHAATSRLLRSDGQ